MEDFNQIIILIKIYFIKQPSCKTRDSPIQYNLLNVFDDIVHLMSGGNTVDMVYLDFAKAFDKVDHGILLHKIKTLGITGKFGVWLYHFLTQDYTMVFQMLMTAPFYNMI